MIQTNTPRADWHPRIFVGADAGSLSSQIPSPVYRPSPVAIELGDGIGFGLDGNSLVVSDKAPNLSMTGHLDDGTYPQRDFSVVHQGDTTAVNNPVYDNMSYTLQRAGNAVSIQNSDPDFCSTFTENGNQITTDGSYPVQKYAITAGPSSTSVAGYSAQQTSEVDYTPNGIHIQGDIPERTFDITQTATGLHIAGYQDDGNGGSKPAPVSSWDVTYAPDGFTIQGYYPQQKYVIKTA